MSALKHFSFLLLALWLAACGEFDRDNPVDPIVSGGVDLRELLVGTWSREDTEKNELYFFTGDGRVELRDYTSTAEGAIDRNASFPPTRVRSFSGSYSLVGNVLRITFTLASSSDPDERLSLPSSDKVVEISISGTRLVLKERDGDRQYTRMS